jgi:hypothetical protein
VLFDQDDAPCHKSITTTAKLHELGYELHPPYSSDLAPSEFFCLQTSEKCLVIVETEAYFKAILKLNYKNGIEKLYDPFNHCIALKRTYIEK